MPIPSPTPKETKDEFIASCIRSIANEYPIEQASAICYQQWKNEPKK
jgi:hypothetical protein